MALRYLQPYLDASYLVAFAIRLGLSRDTALAMAKWWDRRIHPVSNSATERRVPPRVRISGRSAPRSPLFRD